MRNETRPIKVKHKFTGIMLIVAVLLCGLILPAAAAAPAQAASVKYVNPKTKPYSFIFRIGQSRSLALKKYDAGVKPTYKIISGKNCFSVTKNGKVKAKKQGTARLQIKAGTWKKTFYVYCPKARAYNATQNALAMKKKGLKYSQPKRMTAKYVDCSSFVWRSYKSESFFFGSLWGAPTAANEAKWSVRTGHKLSRSACKKNLGLLQPGDVIFYRSPGSWNGRYKNIDHVEMYLGNDTLIHAAHSGIGYDHAAIVNSVVLTRPIK